MHYFRTGGKSQGEERQSVKQMKDVILIMGLEPGQFPPIYIVCVRALLHAFVRVGDR